MHAAVVKMCLVTCRDRKRAIEMLLARTALQDAEENTVLEAAAVIEAAQRQEAAARKAAAQPPPRPGELLPSNICAPMSDLMIRCLMKEVGILVQISCR
jgi:hypothetical protein